MDLKINQLGRAYDVVGFFNYDMARGQVMEGNFARLGLEANRRYHAYDFWHEEYLGVFERGLFLEVGPSRLPGDHALSGRRLPGIALHKSPYHARMAGFAGGNHRPREDDHQWHEPRARRRGIPPGLRAAERWQANLSPRTASR